jgi:hypothetical protein
MLASAIFAVVTASAAISAARIVPSKIFAVVAASVSSYYTAFVIATFQILLLQLHHNVSTNTFCLCANIT